MRFNAGVDGAIFYSHGCKLLGAFYTAAGDTPRPTALLLHGIPGVERNFDLAYALRDAGWNCLVFHYRGSWGSEGNYGLEGLVDDVRAATDWLVQQPSVEGKRLAVIGNSLGGYTALRAGALDERYQAVAALCPLIDPRTRPLEPDLADGFATLLHGISGAEVAEQWLALPSAVDYTPRLHQRPVLLVTAEADELFAPGHYAAFATALAAAPRFEWRRMAEADHSFSRQRRELVSGVVGWLEENLPPGPLPERKGEF